MTFCFKAAANCLKGWEIFGLDDGKDCTCQRAIATYDKIGTTGVLITDTKGRHALIDSCLRNNKGPLGYVGGKNWCKIQEKGKEEGECIIINEEKREDGTLVMQTIHNKIMNLSWIVNSTKG